MTIETETNSRRAGLSPEKQALLEKRLRGALKTASQARRIPRRAQAGRAPLSFAQQRLWFFTQLEPNSPLYNLPTAVRLRGRLDQRALQRALTAIAARHEALRTRFIADEGTPVQIVNAASEVELVTTDLSAVPEAEREAELQRWLRDEAARPFDLARELPMRTSLARMDEADHVLMVNMHHIVSDAWSLGVFFRELGEFYQVFGNGHAASPPELAIQYADYAIWQREWLEGELTEKHLVYWKQQLAGAAHLLELPADRARPPAQTFAGGRASRLLPKSLLNELKALSQREGVTLFMTLLSGFAILLNRYTRQKNLLIGSPSAGRNLLETEGLIGFFVNILPLHADLSGDPTFPEVLGRVRKVTLDGYAHQDLPFERLVEELQPERSVRHPPLVQVVFMLQSVPTQELKLPGVSATPLDFDTGNAKFDLTLAMEDRPEGLLAAAEYNADLFEPATIARTLGHFQTLLEGIVADRSQRISRLPLLTEAERHQVLVEWNDTRTNYPGDKTVSQLFEEQVAKTPDSVALEFEGEELSYRELNARAEQLAHCLRELGVGPDVPVAVCIRRSLEMVVALVGILKAGGAYVSFDPTYPKERLAFMLEDTQSPVLLTQAGLRDRFAFTSVRMLCLDSEWESIVRQGAGRQQAALPVSQPTDLAYVSFTSGSTGRPKGVCVPHRAVVRLVKETDYAQFGPDEVFLQLSRVSFDASTLEIWGALLNGARLVVFPPHTPSLAQLGEFIRKHQITTLWLTAGLFQQMVEEQLENLTSVRQLLAGGDVLSVAHVQNALEKLPRCQLINGYGPTENTTFTCCHRLGASVAADRSIPIGRPIANTQVYVLDGNLQPVPIGVPGELYAGGDGLARGYLKRPELTAERFLPHPFSEEAGARLYKTGDLVRWLSDGTIEFRGRSDLQVKIRGFRVELGEIEIVLGQHPAVKECVVIAREETPGSKCLVAYIVPRQLPAPASNELRTFLHETLPDYMLPSAFVFLNSLPLSANGKVDRRALPRPDDARPDSEELYLAPRDATETQLARIWEEVLGIRPIGVADQFFDLGGHSLLAVRVVAQIEKTFGKQLPVAAIFESPTIEQLAAILRKEKRRAAAPPSIIEIQPAGSRPPLFLVHGVGGGMFWGYTNLSRYLGSDQLVYAFKSRAMDGLEEFDTIEAMATQYVTDLRMFQPHGPYFLGGYCFGGNVAYEMARQLHAQGERVALLALLNSAPTNSGYTRIVPTPAWLIRFIGNACYLIGCYARRTPKQQREFLRALTKRIARLFQRSGANANLTAGDMMDLSNYSAEERQLWDAHLRALFNHHPQPYAGRATLFRSRGHQFLCTFERTYGWRQFVRGGVTVKIVPGAHEQILEEPHVRALAEELKKCLALAGMERSGAP